MPAIRKVLKQTGLTLDQIDLIELNEAFAAQALACMKELDLDPDKVNVNGGAIALGHPLGCTGAKLTATIINECTAARRGTEWSRCVSAAAWAPPASSNECRPRQDRQKVKAQIRRYDMATATSEQTVKGGAWLIEETDPATVMTPEKLTDEHALIRQTAAEFINGEVLPVNERLEQKDWALKRELIKKCGELGLLGTNIPEDYGGVDLDKISTLVVSEQLAAQASFGATFGAQANLTILPIYMFGTEAQKQKYLPGLVSGEVVGAYCLSESGSGSDALGAKTQGHEAGRRQLRALRREDVDHQRRLRRRLHRLRQGRRRALHRLHRRTQVAGRVERQGRAQARPARLVDDAGDPAGREGAGRRGARRDRQGPQGRVQRAELRPLQAGRDVLRRRQASTRRGGEVRGPAQAVRRADRAPSARSSTSSAR